MQELDLCKSIIKQVAEEVTGRRRSQRKVNGTSCRYQLEEMTHGRQLKLLALMCIADMQRLIANSI
jgi:hypothetical protein